MPNKSAQVTFDSQPIFSAAKAGVVSNAPELRRYTPPDPATPPKSTLYPLQSTG